MENKKRKTIVSIITLLSLIAIILLFRFIVFDNYRGKISVKNVESFSTVLSADVSNLTGNTNVSEGYDTVKYTIKYTLDNNDSVLRNAIVTARLSASESRYARFKEVKGNNITSTVSEDGIVVNIENVPTNEEQTLELTLVISNAPYGFKVKPNVTVKEATSNEQTINMDEITVLTNSIEGYALDVDGNKLPSVELSLYEDGTEVRRTYTSTEGEYVFGNLDSTKTYTIKLEEDKYKKVRLEDRSTSEQKKVIDLIAKKVEPFSLDINKYITSLKLNVNGKEETFYYNDETKVLKSVKNLKNLSGSVNYKITIKNTGEISGTIGSIQDIVPEGLSFDAEKNPGWEEKNGKLYYRVLEDQTLTSYEERIATLVLDINKTNAAKTYLNEAIGKSQEYKNVVFIIDGNVYKDIYVLPGESIENEKISDENFSGWYTDSHFTNKYNFNKEVDKNMILYGSLTSAKCKVSFIDNGNLLAEEEIDCGDKVSTRNPQGKTGYTFKYWSLNNQEYDFNSAVTTDIVLESYYEIDTYTITYNLEGGSVEGNNPISYTVESNEITLINPTKEGYTFNGWTGSNGSIPSTNVVIPTGSTGNKEYTAIFSINKYTLIIDPLGGEYEGSTNPISIEKNYGSDVTLSEPSRTGYDFTGWTLDGAGTLNENTYTYGAGNGRVVANYTPKTYTISYELNGGTVSTANPTSYTIESEPITLNNPTKQGYTFTGWTGTGLTNPTMVVTIPTGSLENRTYTANFSIDNYVLTVNPNGGSYNGSINPVDLANDYGTVITLDEPERTGYTFTGWTLTGSGSLVDDVYTYSDGNGTVTANYTINTYNITYEGLTDAEITALNNPTTYTVEETKTLTNPTDRIDQDGDVYETFTGWTYGSTTSLNVTIPVGSTGDKHFKANFVHVDPDTYTITYDYDGGTVSVENPTSYTIKSGAITLNNPTKEGYNFTGWTGTGLTDLTENVTIPSRSTGNRSYVAHYSPINYTITYNGLTDAEKALINNPTSYNIETNTFTLTNPTRAGYTFAGWTGSNGDEPADVTITQGTIGNKTYTANFVEDGYSISYDLQGGAVSTANPISYTVESAPITLNNPTKNGYNFIGWTGTGLNEATETVTIPTGSTGNRSYVANYQVINYTITYTGLTEEEKTTLNNPTSFNIESESFNLINPTRDGYTFTGWTGSNGNTPSNVTILHGSTGNRTYTANFTPTNYGISYNLNGGTVSTDNPTGYNIESAPITLNNPTKEGYNFTGWTGTGLSEATETVTIPTGSKGARSYVANYTPIAYTITYEGLTDAEKIALNNPTSYTIEDNAFALANPTREGYTFIGWTGTNGNIPQLNITIDHGSMGNKTYTANFDINSYTVTYKNGDNTYYTDIVEYGEKTTAPVTNPVKSHSYFSHWSLTVDGAAFDFDTAILDNTTLYAVFNTIEVPTITHTPTAWTNGNVTVDITSSHNDYEYYYKVDDGEYAKYNGNFEVTANGTVYAYSKYGNGTSAEASHEITNIDKINPSVSSVETPYPHTIDLNMTFQDNESGVSYYEIYLDNTLVFTSNNYTEDLNEEKTEIYSLSGLEASTSYTYRIVLRDVAGNEQELENTVTTANAIYVARIIGMGGLIFNDESQYIPFESVQAAINYCSTTQCTIQLLMDQEESVVVTQGQDIALDLDGKTLYSSSLKTIENNGNLTIIDNNSDNTTIGTVANTNNSGTAIVNNEVLTIGNDEGTVSITEPLIIATNVAIDNQKTLYFYDGKAKGNESVKGEVTKTPYAYNATIKSEDDLEILILQVVEEPEARINSKYYTKLNNALNDSKIGTLDEETTDYLSQIQEIGDYGFTYNSTEKYIISENAGLDSTLALSMIELDLTEYTSPQLLAANYSINSLSSNGYGYITILDHEGYPRPTDTSGRMTYVSGLIDNRTSIKELEPGKKYYVYIGYNKGAFSDTGVISYYNDYFKVNSLTLTGAGQTTSFETSFFSNDTYSFKYVDSYYVARDLSGNNDDIPITNSITYAPTYNGVDGIQFDHALLHLHDALTITTDKETFDVEFSSTNNSNETFTIYRPCQGEKIGLYRYVGNGSTYIIVSMGTAYQTYLVPSDMLNGEKHRITVIYDEGIYTPYYDGTLMEPNGSVTNYINYESFRKIGADFVGTIYSMKIYDTALSIQDIDNGLGTENLKMYYDFSDPNSMKEINEPAYIPYLVPNSRAHSYIVFDLRNETEPYIFKFDTHKYSSWSNDIFTVCLTNNDSDPGLCNSSNIYVSGGTDYHDDHVYSVQLIPGQVNYVHFDFQKTNSRDNYITFFDNPSLSKMESTESLYELEKVNDPMYYFARYNDVVIKDLSNNGHDYIDSISDNRYDYDNKALRFKGKKGIEITSPETYTTEETLDIEFSTTNTGSKVIYSGTNNDKIALGQYDNYLIVAAKTKNQTFILPSDINNGAKHRITVTYDNGTYIAYYDGTEMQPNGTVINSFSVSDKLYIGSKSDGTLPYSGYLYSIKVYNAVLTPTEIDADTENENLKLYYNIADSRNVITDNYKYFNNNQLIDNSIAHSALVYDLTNSSKDVYMNISYEISSEENCDYGYITVNDSPNDPGYSDTTGRYFYKAGKNVGTVSVKLTKGKVNYIHFGYKKDRNTNKYDDSFYITSIKLMNDIENKYSINGDNTISGTQVHNIPRLNERVDTIELLKDITVDYVIEIPEEKEVVLDLNGHTLTTSSADYVIDNKGKLTITDSNYTEQKRIIDDDYTAAVANYNSLIDETYEKLLSGELSYNVFEFDYTGSEDVKLIGDTGIYKIETWGASGGDAGEYLGGYGGYSVGEVNLSAGETLYINVGGAGASDSFGSTGGYNGGGNSGNNTSGTRGSGGGASSVATSTGLLSDLSESRNDVLIVSGGGGGANVWNDQYGYGGSGGGYIGNDGTTQYHTIGKGGTQENGGTGYQAGIFGKGANAPTGSPGGAGGGGGYFGGGSSRDNAGAGGGSGYIGNSRLTNKAMYCFECTASDGNNDDNIKTYSVSDYSENAEANKAKDGNGFVRITKLSSTSGNLYTRAEAEDYVNRVLGIQYPVLSYDSMEHHGLITSTTSSTILNDNYGVMNINNAVIDVNKSGTYSAITNRGTLSFGDKVIINVKTESNRGIDNQTVGKLLPGSTVSINAMGNSSIGIYNKSAVAQVISDFNIDLLNNSYGIYDAGFAPKEINNVTINGSGYGLYSNSNYGITSNNLALNTTVSNITFVGNGVNILDLNRQYVFNNSNIIYQGSGYNIDTGSSANKNVIFNRCLIETTNGNSKAMNTASGKFTYNNCTFNCAGTFAYNNTDLTINNSTINTVNGIYNGVEASNKNGNGKVTLNITTLTKVSGDNNYIIRNVYSNLYMYNSHITSEVAAKGINNDANSATIIDGNSVIDGNLSIGVNNLGSLTIGNNSDTAETVFDYEFTGNVQEFTAPRTGNYRFETWGASGGSGDFASQRAGRGAYTAGDIYLEEGTKLYIYVGEKGLDTRNNVVRGPYNGGELSVRYHVGIYYMLGGYGGGATDISTSNEENHLIVTNAYQSVRSTNSYLDRIMVAGAGAGAGLETNLECSNAAGLSLLNTNCSDRVLTSGSQTTGSFGYSDAKTPPIGGRGAGYYSNNTDNYSVGGTSYISGYTGSVAMRYVSGEIKPISVDGNECTDGTTDVRCSYHTSGYVFTNTVMKSGAEVMPDYRTNGTIIGNIGDGHARITYLDETPVANTVKTDYPRITATSAVSQSSVSQNTVVNFYDGILEGDSNRALESVVTTIPDNYDLHLDRTASSGSVYLVNTTDSTEENYVAAIVDSSNNIVSKYTTLAAAVEAVPTGTTNTTTINILRDIKTMDSITIPNNKNITIDYKGHSVDEHGDDWLYINNGILNITNTGTKDLYSTSYGKGYFYNNGTSNISNIYIQHSLKPDTNIINNGTMALSGIKYYQNTFASRNNLGIQNNANASLDITNTEFKASGIVNNVVDGANIIHNYGQITMTGITANFDSSKWDGQYFLVNEENASAVMTNMTLSNIRTLDRGWVFVDNYGYAELNNASLNNGVTKNHGTFKYNTITTSGYEGRSHFINYEGNVEIDGGTYNNMIYNQDSGVMTIKSGTFGYPIYQTSSGDLNIEGGTYYIYDPNKFSIPITTSTNVNVGIKGDGTVSTSNPSITGKSYGIDASADGATINFYDGIISGPTAIYGMVNETESNYTVYVENNNGIESKYLINTPVIKNMTTGTEYIDVNQAFDEATDNDTLKFLRNTSIPTNNPSINNTKTLILDLNSNYIDVSNDSFIINNGNLTIINSPYDATTFSNAVSSTYSSMIGGSITYKTYDFRYTGNEDIFVAPYTGTYKVQLWGAQGLSGQAIGGKGAYTSGTIELNKGDKLYLHVGTNYDSYKNTYNGGTAGGGGATDISTESRTTDNYASRIMVAGGGGAAFNDNSKHYKGGDAGALVGFDAEADSSNPARGATQTAGGNGYNNRSDRKGSFGVGGSDRGGGGGYYGGGGGNSTSSAGGGGSSYISGYTGSVAIKSATDRTPKAGCNNGTTDITCSYHYSGYIFNNTVMLSGQDNMISPRGVATAGNEGEGYARITLINTSDSTDITYTLEDARAYTANELNVTRPEENTSGTIKDNSLTPIIVNNGTLTINAGTYTDKQDNVYTTLFKNNGTMVVNDGKFIKNIGNVANTELIEGSIIENTSSLTINDGTFDLREFYQSDYAYLNTVLYNKSGGTINVNGGNFNNSSKYDLNYYTRGRLFFNYGTINIKGITSNYSSVGRNYGTATLTDVNMRELTIGYEQYSEATDSCRTSVDAYYCQHEPTVGIISNYGTMTIIGGGYATDSQFIYNEGTLDINPSTGVITTVQRKVLGPGKKNRRTHKDKIMRSLDTSHNNINNIVFYGVEGTGVIYNDSIYDYNITNSEFYSTGNTPIVYNTSGDNINITNCIFDVKDGYGIYTSGVSNLVINDSTIISQKNYGIYNTGAGTLTLGTKGDGVVSTTSPIVMGPTSSIYTNNSSYVFNFYDGIIKGVTNALSASVSTVEDGYTVVDGTEVINNKTYKTKYLDKVEVAQNTRTLVKYYDLYSAFDEAVSGDTIRMINNYTTLMTDSTIEISAGDTYTLELNGYHVFTSINYLFDNKGTLTINDFSTNQTGLIFSTSGTSIFDNSGTLTIDRVNIETNNIAKILVNEENATANIQNGSNLHTDYEINIIDNYGTMTIDDSRVVNVNDSGMFHYVDMIINRSTGTMNVSDSLLLAKGSSVGYERHPHALNNAGTAIIDNITLSEDGETDLSVFGNTGNITIRNVVDSTPVAFINNTGTALIEDSDITICSVGADYSYASINSSGNLTIDSSVIRDTGNNKVRTSGSGITMITNTSFVTPNSATELLTEGRNSNVTYDNINITSSNGVESKAYISSNTASGITNIKNSNIRTNNNYAILPKVGTINIENTNITSLSSTGSAISVITSSGSETNFKSGTITSNNDAVYNERSGSVVNIGTNDSSYDENIVTIRAERYATNNTGAGSINFYDGTIGGKTNSNYGPINNVEDGYRIRTKTEDGYTIAYQNRVDTTEAVAESNGITFDSLQTAINYAVRNNAYVVLVSNVGLDADITASSAVTLYLNGYTITSNGYTVANIINVVSGSPSGGSGSISHILGNILGIGSENKELIIYEMEDGSALSTNVNYRLYKDNKLQKVNEEEAGTYSIGSEDEILKPIKGRIYIRNVSSGNYKLVGSDNKEISFSIDNDGKVTGNVKEYTIKENNYTSNATAELIIAIQTGVRKVNYMLIAISLIAVLSIMFVLKKRSEQEE